jgi:hypothetical protein
MMQRYGLLLNTKKSVAIFFWKINFKRTKRWILQSQIVYWMRSECSVIGPQHDRLKQGCQVAYFQTKNPDLGKFWRVLPWEMLVYFMVIWSILLPFGIFCGPLTYFIVICNISSFFGMLHQEKSGNPGLKHESLKRKWHALLIPSVSVSHCDLKQAPR